MKARSLDRYKISQVCCRSCGTSGRHHGMTRRPVQKCEQSENATVILEKEAGLVYRISYCVLFLYQEVGPDTCAILK
jgi:hypothetical protein